MSETWLDTFKFLPLGIAVAAVNIVLIRILAWQLEKSRGLLAGFWMLVLGIGVPYVITDFALKYASTSAPQADFTRAEYQVIQAQILLFWGSYALTLVVFWARQFYSGGETLESISTTLKVWGAETLIDVRYVVARIITKLGL